MSGLGDPQAIARWNAIKTQVMPALGVPLDYALFTPYDACLLYTSRKRLFGIRRAYRSDYYW